MSEFNPKQRDKLSVGINTEQQQRKEKYMGSFKLQKGQSLFELDLKTGNIELAHYESSTALFPTKETVGGITRKLYAKENCIYAPAINLVNAKKKFNKIIARKNKSVGMKQIPVDCKECGSIVMSYLVKNPNSEVIFDTCECGHTPTISEYL